MSTDDIVFGEGSPLADPGTSLYDILKAIGDGAILVDADRAARSG